MTRLRSGRCWKSFAMPRSMPSCRLLTPRDGRTSLRSRSPPTGSRAPRRRSERSAWGAARARWKRPRQRATGRAAVKSSVLSPTISVASSPRSHAPRSVGCARRGRGNRHNCTFTRSRAGGHRAAAIYTLIETSKLTDVARGLARQHPGAPVESWHNESPTASLGTGNESANKKPPLRRLRQNQSRDINDHLGSANLLRDNGIRRTTAAFHVPPAQPCCKEGDPAHEKNCQGYDKNKPTIEQRRSENSGKDGQGYDDRTAEHGVCGS
jgi:hypothetical protein